MEFFGRAVLKEFKGHGVFHGRVADYHRESGYRVMYEDGDVEDLKRDALLVLLDKTARMKKEMDKHSKPRAAAVAAAVAAAGDDGSAWVPPPPPLNPSAAGGSRTLAEFVKRARDASRRKRKHTDLTVKSAERARLKPPPPPKRVLEEEEVRLPMPKPPTWALGMPRDPRYIRVDADSAWGPTPRLRDEAGLFQLSLFWESPIAVAVSWTFPPANPGDASAWVGLFPAVCVAWHDQYGEVSSGAAKLGYRTLTQNQSRGTVCFRRLIETAPDGEYVFTLQRDYGVRCSAVSDRFQIRGGRVVGCFAATALATEADEQMDHKQRQRDACLNMLVHRGIASPAAGCDEEAADSRCYFPLCAVDVCLGREYDTPLLKAIYRIVDKESYLDWGLSSDFESVHGAQERGGHHVRNRREVIPHAGLEGAPPPPGGIDLDPPRLMKLGLGGGALGSEGYGEATMGSVHRIGVALQHLRQLVLRDLFPDGWGLLWDLGPWSSFLDVGSGYGKVVLHLRLLTGMHSSVGVECVLSRHQIAMRSKHLCDIEAAYVAANAAATTTANANANFAATSTAAATATTACAAAAAATAAAAAAALSAADTAVGCCAGAPPVALGAGCVADAAESCRPGARSRSPSSASLLSPDEGEEGEEEGRLGVGEDKGGGGGENGAAGAGGVDGAEGTEMGVEGAGEARVTWEAQLANGGVSPDVSPALPGVAAATVAPSSAVCTMDAVSRQPADEISAADAISSAISSADALAVAHSATAASGVITVPDTGGVPTVPERVFDGIELRHSDVTVEARLAYTHIYIFDWVFSKPTLKKMAKLLQASPFYVLVSFRKPSEWWGYGLVKAQPVAKLQGFRTTGHESMTAWVYINLDKVPGRTGAYGAGA